MMNSELPSSWEEVLRRTKSGRVSKVFVPAAVETVVRLVERGSAPDGDLAFDDFERVFIELMAEAELPGAGKAWMPFASLGRRVGLIELIQDGRSAEFRTTPTSRAKLRAVLDGGRLGPEVLSVLESADGRQTVRSAVAGILAEDNLPDSAALARAITG